MKLDDLGEKLNFTKAAMQKVERKQMDIIEAVRDIVLTNKLSVASRSPTAFSDSANIHTPKAIKFNIIEEDDEPAEAYHNKGNDDMVVDDRPDLSQNESESLPVMHDASSTDQHNWRLLLDRCKSVPASRDIIPEDDIKEYSTILDRSDNTSGNNSVISISPYESFVGNLFDPTHALRKNANSFVIRENKMLREYEEDGSVVAGSLLHKRIRTTSVSLGTAGAHDLLVINYFCSTVVVK